MFRFGQDLINKMAWSSFPNAIKKRAIKYLLNRYVGQFLEEKLSLDQLTVDLYKGTGTIKELTIDVDALNEAGEQLNIPFKFVDGYIGEICLSVPWHNLLQESCFVEVTGLMITMEPKQRAEDISMVDSMIESMNMTSSMQIAQECLNQQEDESEMDEPYERDAASQVIDGLEHFAHAIDSVLSRTKVRFIDTVIRLEYAPKQSNSGVALEVRINQIDYFDEVGLGKSSPTSDNKGYEQAAFASKKFHIEGISLYTDEFPVKTKTPEKPMVIPTPDPSPDDSKVYVDSFKTAETSPAEDKNFVYNHEKTVNKLINSSAIPLEPILFAKFTGHQEISLKLKQAEVIGPKVEFRMSCGSFITFLSPRQIHLLLELSEGIASPEKVDLEPTVLRGKQKPMDPSDYKRVENELLKELRSKPVSSHALNQQQGWSVAPLEDSDDDEFVPMGTPGGGLRNMSSSQLSVCSDLESSFSSNMSSSTIKSSYTGAQSSSSSYRYTGAGVMTGDHGLNVGRRRSDHSSSKLNDDPSATVTHFRVQISSIAAIILHEDILTPSTENSNIVSQASVSALKTKCSEFFSTLGVYGMGGFSYNEFKKSKEAFTEACQLNHLRIMAAPLTVVGTEKSLSSRWEMNITTSLGSAEVLECLVDSKSSLKAEYSELLIFKDTSENKSSEPSAFMEPVEPKLKISISQSQNMNSRSRRMSTPKLDVKVNLAECSSEIDMSIVDRIGALINRQEVCTKAAEEVFSTDLPPSYINNQACFKQMIDDATLKPETKVNVRVTSSAFTVKLRFPIPDLRPKSEMAKVPWWRRNLRKDILSLKLKDFDFVTTLDPQLAFKKYEIRSGDMHVYFQEREEDSPISLLQASSSKGAEKGFDLPHVVITVHPTQLWSSLEDEMPRPENIMTKSMMGFLEEVADEDANPFSKRKLAYQQGEGNAGEQTIPSGKEEILEFMENTVKNVQFQIDLHIPSVQLILPSKHIYEVVYNRLVSDLLLWEPSMPKPVNHTLSNINCPQGGLDLASVFMNESIYQSTNQFTLCNSYKTANSDSDEEEESQFYSVIEHNKLKAKQQQHQQQHQQQQQCEPSNKKQTTVAFKFTIGHGVASVRTPYRDAKNNVLPGQHGEVMLVLEQGTIFATSGYQGSPDLGYTCIWADKGHIYHKAANITPDQPVILDPSSPLSTSRLEAILYPSDPGVVTKLGTSSPKVEEDNEDQFTLSLKMDFDPTRNLKTIILAGCLRGTTVRHYMCSNPESWITQLGDMFDVKDYPIEGYVLPDVITEMNFHLWHCALDYRPLYLPLRVLLTVDLCSICSNLTISSDTSVLHFVIEDAGLFLSEKLTARTIDMKNFVCVADLGVFELSLRMVDDPQEKKPKIDLVASNNRIHIRTCADSCKALLELIIYLASDGDLVTDASVTPERQIDPNSSFGAGSPLSDCPIARSPDATDETDPQAIKLVMDMMDNAMIEMMQSTPSTNSYEDENNDPSLKNKVEMFFFPDDENMQQQQKATNETPKDVPKQEVTMTNTEYLLEEAITEQLDHPFEEGSSGTDEEFCILDDAPGTGIKSPSGQPQVRILTPDPIAIVENHFSVPVGKVDQLKAPKHFPMALLKYTLKELTVVWQMYGGSDFRTKAAPKSKRRNVTIRDSNGNSDIEGYPSGIPRQIRVPKTEPRAFVRGSEVHFTSGYSGTSPTNYKKSPPQSPQQRPSLNWQSLGGPDRRHDTLLELHLNKIRFQHEIYPETAEQVSRYVLLIYDVQILDKLASSKIKKFLYQYSSETCPRQTHANMVQVKALTSRPDGLNGPQETSLKIALQPIRLHVDQDTLLFLFSFFEELFATEKDGDIGEEEKPYPATLVKAPVMNVNIKEASKISGDNQQQVLVNLEDKSPVSENEEKLVKNGETPPPYFKSFVFSPAVPIRVDYHGKRVQFNSQYGPIAGLFFGLGQLNHSEITLKSIVHKSGLLGVDRLVRYVTNEWANDIRRNQLPSVLGGVGPMHSVSQLVGGIRDLFLLPIEQYQKDGRLVRGIQRGASAFTTSSAHAALDLTGRFVGCIQSAAETMYDMVSSGPSVHHRYRQRGGQPQDIREGVTTAYGVVKDGIGETATAIVQAASEEHHHKGMSGAIGGVLRQIPPAAVKPIIIASEAAGTVIGGMKNQLVPDARREAAEKWKS